MTSASLQVDFAQLLSAVRANQPRCPDCSHPLQHGVCGAVQTRLKEDGKPEEVCGACYFGELGECLVQDLPSARF